MEEFRSRYSQTQPGIVMLTTATKWAMFQAIFGMNKNGEICVP